MNMETELLLNYYYYYLLIYILVHVWGSLRNQGLHERVDGQKTLGTSVLVSTGASIIPVSEQ